MLRGRARVEANRSRSMIEFIEFLTDFKTIKGDLSGRTMISDSDKKTTLRDSNQTSPVVFYPKREEVLLSEEEQALS